MHNTLVVFYSRKGENYMPGGIQLLEKGHTAFAAEYIRDAIGAELLELETQQPYAENYRECCMQAMQEAKAKARPALKSYPADISQYDTIFVCFPCWCGTAPMCVFTFLERYDLTGKRIIDDPLAGQVIALQKGENTHGRGAAPAGETDKNGIILGNIRRIAFKSGASLGLGFLHGLHAAFPIIFRIGLLGFQLQKLRTDCVPDVFRRKGGVALFQKLNAAGHIIFALAGVKNYQSVMHGKPPLQAWDQSRPATWRRMALASRVLILPSLFTSETVRSSSASSTWPTI